MPFIATTFDLLQMVHEHVDDQKLDKFIAPFFSQVLVVWQPVDGVETATQARKACRGSGLR